MTQKGRELPSVALRKATGIDEIQDAVIRGGIAGLPFIGTIMNELLFNRPNNVQLKRLEETVQVLKEKVQRFEGNAPIERYIQSDDFYDFNVNFWKSALKIRDEKIRKTLANVFIDSILTQEDYELSVNRLYLNFLVDLSPIQIILISFIETNESLLDRIETYDNFFTKYNEYDKKIAIDSSEFKFYCLDLENKGLISTNGGLRDFGVTDFVLYDHRYVEPSVNVTELGKRFVQYLTD